MRFEVAAALAGADRRFAYTWDFGDGRTGTGDRVEHLYLGRGVRTVTLEVASHPDGAKVIRLDTGELLGVTPLKLQTERLQAPIGLRLELVGHDSIERQVVLANNASLSVDLPVEARPPEPVKPTEKKPRKKVTRDGQVDPFSN